MFQRFIVGPKTKSEFEECNVAKPPRQMGWGEALAMIAMQWAAEAEEWETEEEEEYYE